MGVVILQKLIPRIAAILIFEKYTPLKNNALYNNQPNVGLIIIPIIINFCPVI